MNKKLIALVLSFALVFSSFSAAFADTAIPADAQAAKDLGMLVGNGNGVTIDYLKENPTRLTAALMFLRLQGLESAALSYTGTDNFADAKDMKWAEGKNVLAYLKANKQLGWVGVGNGTNFAPNDKIDAQSYYKVMLEALGYKANTAEVIGDFTWSQVFTFAASKGLTKVAGVTNFVVNDIATATIEALKANVAGSTTQTLAAKLVDAKVIDAAKAAAAGLYTPATVALAVESVTATNLKTMKIDFNSQIDPASVTTSTVKVTKAGVTVVNSLNVTADKKSVVVELTGVTQSDSLVITVDGVKSATGSELKGYTITKSVIDITIPEILSATVLNQKQIEVFFNEPINFTIGSFQVLNNIKMDGIAVIAKATPNLVTNSIVFEFPSIIADGTHTFSVSNVADFASYKVATKEFQVSVVADKTAPVLTNAVAKNTTTLEVTFSEKLDTVGTIKVNGITATTINEVVGSNGTKYTVTGGFTALDLTAIVEVKVAYSGQKDIAGNTVATEQTYKFNVVDDTVLPTATAVIANDNKITVTFSKSMDISVGTITVKDSKGATLGTVSAPFTFKANTNNTVLEIQAASVAMNNINADNVTVNVKGMKDATIRANILPETNMVLAAKDTKKPSINVKYFVVAGTTAAQDTVTFYFDEAMDTTTLNNLSNYIGSTLGSLSVVNGAKVNAIAADAKSIVITIPGANAAATAGETFTVSALKDSVGNMMNTTAGVSKLASTALTVTGAESVDGTKVKVTFNTKVTAIDPSALKVQKAAADYAVFVNVVLASDGMSATFTANKNLGTDMSVYTLVDNNITLVKNIYDTALSTLGAGVAVADKVAPTVTVATGDSAGQIKLTFSEAVKVTDLATLKNDLVIRDKNGALVNIDGTTITATLSLGTGAGAYATGFDKIVIGGLTTTENYTVTLISRNVTDLAISPIVVAELPVTTISAK